MTIIAAASFDPAQPAPAALATPQPTPDRLAIPTPPANPTQAEEGNIVYYYNCMPCHGDVGQGLTDEFRQVWEEDHRNCWGRGCHGGKEKDEGFPLPRFIPGVRNLNAFSAPQDLYEYLRLTHPPQRPGVLTDEEYWSVTAHLLVLAGRLSPDGRVGPPAAAPATAAQLDPASAAPAIDAHFGPATLLAGSGSLVLLLLLAMLLRTRRAA
ncbi:MAG: hypothetical protein AB1894_05335 [Chloroflexota bacterium]